MGILKSLKLYPAGRNDPYMINYQWPTLFCFVRPRFTVLMKHVTRQSKSIKSGAHTDIHFYPNVNMCHINKVTDVNMTNASKPCRLPM